MRVVLHIGLHKTGTSTLQRAWRASLGTSKETWYPPLPHGPSHAGVAWGLRHAQGVPLHVDLAEVVGKARSQGTQTLVLSSEEFHSAGPERLANLPEMFAGCTVDLLVTLTQPVFRWPSLWQEMIKHGWAAGQAKSAARIDEAGVFGDGRLEELVERWAMPSTTIALVRQHPAEPRLVDRISALMGIPLPAKGRREGAVENPSLGDVETRILCEVNRLAPGTRGITSDRGRAVMAALRVHGPAGAPRVQLDPDVIDHVAEMAVAEQAGLRRLLEAGRIRLDDPWGLLDRWAEVPSIE